MKTQFVVTVTQKGENPVKPSYLSRAIRGRMHGGLATKDDEITVRHLVEDAPDALPAAASAGTEVALGRGELRDALRKAHQAGQKSGMRVGKDSFDTANSYAGDAMGGIVLRPVE